MAKGMKPGRPASKAVKPAKPAGKKRVTFSIQAEPGRKVAVAGSFNEWDPEAHVLKDKTGSGAYTATVLLAPGTYEYKFVIDGTWCVDPACAEWVQNDCGTLNSLLRV